MSATAPDVLEQYKQALAEYVVHGGETSLHSAYELGRQAVASNLGLLSLIGAHGDALAEVLKIPEADPAALRRAAEAAHHFLGEALSSFEMLHLRDLEANEALRRMNDMLEQEAKRVAHALHDQAGTILATVYLELAEISRELPGPLVARLQQVTFQLDQVREQLRHLSHEVRPRILDELGLVPALRFLAEGIAKRSGIMVEVDGVNPTHASSATNTTVYRVVQEALTNVTRHARATRASVHMWREGGRLHCLVRDNGVGFDVATLRSGSGRHGLGLIGMEERIRALGGDFQITSRPGQGTTVRLSLPKQRE